MTKRPVSAEALYHREKRAKRRRVLATGSQAPTRDRGAGPRKPAITTAAIQAIIEACRPEYLRQIARDTPRPGRPRKDRAA